MPHVLHVMSAWALLQLPISPLPAMDASTPTTRPLIHPLFSDHAVLQRGRPIPVWGWADPGRRLTIRIAGASASATAGADGRWQTDLPAMEAGGPYDLIVTGAQTVTVKDVLFGEVWLCAGQSNMAFPLGNAIGGQEAARQPGMDHVRLMRVPSHIALDAEPAPPKPCLWQPSDGDSARAFAAVGWFFGRALQRELHVPIGLIGASWGGTSAECWVDGPALAKVPGYGDHAARLHTEIASLRNEFHGDEDARHRAWWQAHDPGSAGPMPREAAPDHRDDDWRLVNGPPASLAHAGFPDFAGVVWLRYAFELPAAWAGHPATFTVSGNCDYTVFLDGQEIGTGRYGLHEVDCRIPASGMHAGRSVIAIRLFAPDDRRGLSILRLRSTIAGTMDCTNGWRVRTGPSAATTGPSPYHLGVDHMVPTVLYNGMINPLEPYGLGGIIWYQGEQDAGAPEHYADLLQTLISSWRTGFGHELPFGIVQLPSLGRQQTQPVTYNGWAQIREAQAATAQALPQVGLTVNLDFGDVTNLHPPDKRPVGEGLARWALHTVYGRTDVAWSGPWFQRQQIEGHAIRLFFEHVENGLMTQGGVLQGFAIAGADRRFFWGDARIEGTTVVVSSPQIATPVAIRYGWDRNPLAKLRNGAGLPAAPFRTDHWDLR